MSDEPDVGPPTEPMPAQDVGEDVEAGDEVGDWEDVQAEPMTKTGAAAVVRGERFIRARPKF